MKKLTSLFFCLFLLSGIMYAFEYPVTSKTLANGLKVIVCQKPGNSFVQVEVWYRTGSKDEMPGIRGMAHLFEHMMFRGTKKFPGTTFIDNVQKVGGDFNAYTADDRTVYYQHVPASAMEQAFDMEADRMNNLVVTQEILNTEREVVGEELRNSLNSWYGKMDYARYPLLYPEGHPYQVTGIGYLNEILNFTTEQCMDFYNRFYSPNNAFVIVVGDVKSEDVFAMAEKYFGTITKYLDIKPRENIPDLFTAKLKKNDLPIDFPVQIYSFVYPRPEFNSSDLFPLEILEKILFAEDNSILNNRLVKQDLSAYAVVASRGNGWSLHTEYGIFDVVMQASPGNVKVKRTIREEIDKIIQEGVSRETIDKVVDAMDAKRTLDQYTSSNITAQLGMAEFYMKDYRKANTLTDSYKEITPEQVKAVASKYFSEDRLQIINIKPAY